MDRTGPDVSISAFDEFGARLARVALVAAALALGITVIALFAIELPLQRNAVGQHLQTLATSLASNVADSADTADGTTATRVLASLRNEREMEQVLLLGFDGRVVASFSAGGHIQSDGQLGERDGWLQRAMKRPEPTLRHSGLTRTELVQPVMLDGRRVGHLYLASSLAPLRDRLLLLLVAVALTAALALSGAWIVARRLQRRVSLPLAQLLGRLQHSADTGSRLQLDGRDPAAEVRLFEEAIEQLTETAEHNAQELRQRCAQLDSELLARASDMDQAQRQLQETRSRLQESEAAGARVRTQRMSQVNRLHQQLHLLFSGLQHAAESLALRPASSEDQELVDANLEAVDAALALCNGLYDAVGGALDEMPTEISAFDIGDLLERVATLYAPRAHEKHIEVLVDIDPALQTEVRGDIMRVRFAMLNLFSNAIRFTTRGTITLRLRVLGEKHGMLGLRLEVSDTGIGISAENRKTLLSAPSPGAETAVARQEPAAQGRGLAVAQRLVQSVGGRIELSSDFGRGSTITVDLTLPAAAGRRTTMRDGLAAAHILVVDDHAGSREWLQKQLSGFGHQVVAVPDVDGARTHLAQVRPAGTAFDLVLVDGIESLRQLRSLTAGRAIPAVLLGSPRETVDSQSWLELEPAGYLAKPMRALRLRHIVDGVGGELSADGAYRLLERA